MRISRIFLVFTLLFPALTFAQSANFSERSHIFRTQNGVPLEDPVAACADATPCLPLGLGGAATAQVSTVVVEPTQGRLSDEAGVVIGTLTACWDIGQEVIDPFGPTIDFGIVYIMRLGWHNLAGLGTMRVRTPGGFPEGEPGLAGMNMTASGATLFRLDENMENVGMIGTMTSNVLNNPPGIEGYHTGGVIVLRTFEQRDLELEAIVSAVLEAMRGQ